MASVTERLAALNQADLSGLMERLAQARAEAERELNLKATKATSTATSSSPAGNAAVDMNAVITALLDQLAKSRAVSL